MRHPQLVLIVGLGWCALLGAALGAGWLLGPLPAAMLGGIGAVLALALSVLLAQGVERRHRERLGRVGSAIGLLPDEAANLEAILRSLCDRLERAQQFRHAFLALRAPAILHGEDGQVIAATAGAIALDVRLAEPGPIEAVLTTDAEIRLGDTRYTRHSAAAGTSRIVSELARAGHYVSADDLEAFDTAMRSGLPGFRFDDWSRSRSPAIGVLAEALEATDGARRAIAAMLEGAEPDPGFLRSGRGLAPLLSDLCDAIGALVAERDELGEARDRLDAKMEAILNAIDRYRASVTTLAQLADQSRAGLAAAGAALSRSRERTHELRALETQAQGLVGTAAQQAVRVSEAIDRVGATAAEIDRLTGAIEDVSFRSNLLALNAAVEAARAGERGASFAVVASEVRTLAQASQAAVKQIRQLVSRSRAETGQSAGEIEKLRNVATGLGAHLENLSNATDMIAGALDEGSGAIARLDGSVSATGTEAAKALQLPRRARSV